MDEESERMLLANLSCIESIHPLARQFGQHSESSNLPDSKQAHAGWQTWTNETGGGGDPLKRARSTGNETGIRL
jgi:hypothetical protein